MLCIVSSSYGAGVGGSEAELGIPTLTKLNAQNPDIVPIQSAYTLERSSTPGLNTITKFLENPDGTLTAVYYDIKYKPAGDLQTASDVESNNYYYKWETDAKGNKQFVQSSPANPDVSVYLSNKAGARISTDLAGADVKDNFAGLSNSRGGAISIIKAASAGNIEGTFTGNSVSGSDGGAIRNEGTIENITGDFIGNRVSDSWACYGGAISNGTSATTGNAIIKNITGNFIGNYANPTSGQAHGGAISNNYHSDIENILGDFIGNYAYGGNSSASGGAIRNSGTSSIKSITGDFMNNYVYATSNGASGGAIINEGSSTMGDITGDFAGNYAKALAKFAACGGAVYNNRSTIGDITGDFTENYVVSASSNVYGGAVYNFTSAVSNTTSALGSIKGDFSENYAVSDSGNAYGGAIYNEKGIIKDITGNFINNYVSGKAAYGGALYNCKAISLPALKLGVNIGDIIDSSFIGNYAVASSSNSAKGGAIYTDNTLNFIAKNKNVLFSGNYISDDGGITKTPNAVHMAGSTDIKAAPNLNLNAAEGKAIIFNDPITSEADNNVININKPGSSQLKDPSINAPTAGTVILNADMSGFGAAGINNEVNFHYGILKLGKDFNYFSVPINVVAGGSQLLDMSGDNDFSEVRLNNFTLNNNLNVIMDVDLENKTSDTFTGTPGGAEKINISGFNIQTHTEGVVETGLLIADGDAMGSITLDDRAKELYTPIYKYDVDYDNTSGILTFNGGMFSEGDIVHTDFNPSVLIPAAAQQAGSLQALAVSYQHGFRTLDTVAYFNSVQENSALANEFLTVQSQDMVYLEQAAKHYESATIWFQPYAVFETVQLKNGPEVSHTGYGSYFGVDSGLFDFENGWKAMYGAYGGYNGSRQTYEGIGIDQNGGTFGLTGAVLKKDFFSGLTANFGVLSGEGGQDNFTSLFTGIALKTGYNLHFKESKFVFQPSMLFGYSYFKTFDYTTASGVNMKSSPADTIMLSPELRFIANLHRGWQPYISVSGWWNITGESKFTADDTVLPELAAKPYIQYGAGVKKSFNDNFSGFFQTMVRSIDRNSFGFSAGLNYSF
jgi:hypothetical protein